MASLPRGEITFSSAWAPTLAVYLNGARLVVANPLVRETSTAGIHFFVWLDFRWIDAKPCSMQEYLEDMRLTKSQLMQDCCVWVSSPRVMRRHKCWRSLNGTKWRSEIMLILSATQTTRWTCSCTVWFVGVDVSGRDEEGGGMEIAQTEKLHLFYLLTNTFSSAARLEWGVREATNGPPGNKASWCPERCCRTDIANIC